MQLGIFTEDGRLEKLSKLGDSLEKLKVIAWEDFRPTLNVVFKKERKSNAGRPPYDYLLLFKVLILQRLFNLSDDQTEYQINDRMSFMRFLGLSLGDKVPDAKTIWLFRDTLTQANVIENLFCLFKRLLEQQGIITHTGMIVDATFVDAPGSAIRVRKINSSKAAISPKNGRKTHPKLHTSWRKRIPMLAGR